MYLPEVDNYERRDPYLVTDAFLGFVKSNPKEINDKIKGGGAWLRHCSEKEEYLLPVFYSLKESSNKYDWLYRKEQKKIFQTKVGFSVNGCNKILVLPQNIAPRYLDMIINGDLKEGDKVKVKCHRATSYSPDKSWVAVSLNKNKHATLFDIKLSLEEKIESICEDFIKEYQRQMFDPAVFKPLLKKALKEMALWAKKNNY